MCLTDGYSDHDPPYSTTLEKARVILKVHLIKFSIINAQAYGVIIDTVLLTWPDVNAEQKALCHASGTIKIMYIMYTCTVIMYF